MSAKSVKKAVFNEAAEALYSPFPNFVTPDYFPYDLPWPEWSDADINAEKWEEGKGKGTPKSTPKSDATTPKTAVDYFIDPEPLTLLYGLQENLGAWKRPGEAYQKPVLYDPSNAEFELSIPSKFVKPNEFFKNVIELLPLLQFHALKEGFPVEAESPTYIPNTQGQSWRPWHHIYALCKAGKGQPHKPIYFTYGKYILRLFFMGAWRKIIVDDRLPFDEDGKCMFPVTQVSGEIWPMILCKGLMKIASLTPTPYLSAMDFPFLSVFTGWIDGYNPTKSKGRDEIWRWLWALTPHYEWPKSPGEGNITPASVKKGDRTGMPTVARPCFVIGKLSDFPPKVSGLSPYHHIGFAMSRNIPLIRVPRRPDTQIWKRLRWVYWASHKGIWTDELLIPPYQCLQHFTYSKKLHDLLFVDPNLENRLFLMPANPSPPPSPPNTGGALLLKERKPEEKPMQWSDFTKVKKYLTGFYTFYKPCAFASKMKVTYIRLGPPAAKAAAAKGPAKLPPGSYLFSPSMTLTQNEPPLLFCEASTGIFICFQLSACPNGPINCPNYLGNEQPEVLKVYHASLTIERYNWWSIQQGEILGDTKTVGSNTLHLYLNPGRHIMRLWLDTDSPYVINIFSNVELTVFKGSKIRFMMASESPRVVDYINRLSNSFITLTQKFGKPEFRNALKDFYAAIRPGNDKLAGYYKYMDDFIESFINRMVCSIRPLVPNDEEMRMILLTFRCLFMNPRISYPLPPRPPGSPPPFPGSVKKPARKGPPPPALKPRDLSEILSYNWSASELKKIRTIQGAIRGYQFRVMMKRTLPSSKDIKILADRLKKTVDFLFSPVKRELEIAKLIRDMLIEKPKFFDTFRFHEDIPNVIKVEEFTGVMPSVQPFAWIPMFRFVISCHSKVPVPCAFYLSCNLQQFQITAIDNDSKKELFKLTNSVAPFHYTENLNGYTIFGYGWNESMIKHVNWRLEMVSIKYMQVIHPCNTISGAHCSPYRPPNLMVRELKNFYLPNHKHRICKCLIKIRKKVLVSLRLSSSYDQVHFKVKIYSTKSSYANAYASFSGTSFSSDKLIAEADSSSGAALFPSLILEHFETKIPSWGGESSMEFDDTTTYMLKAIVRYNSWPLTSKEWGMVEPIRTGGEVWPETTSTSTASLLSRKSSASSRKKSASRLPKPVDSKPKVVESPFWLLQVITDMGEDRDGPESFMVLEDKSYADAVRVMKMSWEDNEPGRRKRGRWLREEFLRLIHIEEKERNRRILCGEALEEDYYLPNYEIEGEAFTREDSFELQLLQMKSFSYLLNDLSPERLYTSPRILPVMPTSRLMKKHGVSESGVPNVRDTEDVGNFLTAYYSAARIYIEDLVNMEDLRKSITADAQAGRIFLEGYLMSEAMKSDEMMKNVSEERLKVIQRIKRLEKERGATSKK